MEQLFFANQYIEAALGQDRGMLTLSKGVPIAEYKSSPKARPLIIKYCPKEKDAVAEIGTEHREMLLTKPWARKFRLTEAELESVRDAVKKGNASLMTTPRLQHAYAAAEEEMSKQELKCVAFPEGEGKISFIPPLKGQCDNPWFRAYIAANSGSGKTTWIKQCLEKIQADDPSMPVYIFCPPGFRDFTLATQGCPYIVKNASYVDLESPEGIRQIIEEPLTMEEFARPDPEHEDDPDDMKRYKGTVMVFDDIEVMTHNKTLRSSIMDFLNKCLYGGRHFGLIIFIVRHIGKGGLESNPAIREVQYFVTFPGVDAFNALDFLKSKVVKNKEVLEMISELPTRALVFSKPQNTFIYDHGVFIL